MLPTLLGGKMKTKKCRSKYLKEYNKNYYKNNAEKCKENAAKWYKNNKERHNELGYKWAKNNPEKVKESHKKYRKNNPEKIKGYREKFYKGKGKSLFYCLNSSIRVAIWQSLRNNKNGKSGKHWENIVNFTLKELITHLEKLFKSGMNWSNYGKSGWEIDHQKPVSSFNFKSYEDEDFKKCWSLENLQPLWIRENRRKYNKII